MQNTLSFKLKMIEMFCITEAILATLILYEFCKTELSAMATYGIIGISSYVLPPSCLPDFFLLTPPHCLKKKETLVFLHC